VTLGKKKIPRTVKKYKPKLIVPTEKGIIYVPTGELWEYPIFAGKTIVHNIGTEPLLTEFLSEGKNWVFVSYDRKLGMVAKARLPSRHAYYVLQELISRRGKVPLGGLIDGKKLNEILATSKMTKYVG